ncbi:hypothetical protein NL676_002860 [Syzygium grande]|nr:hypothetical protein NL676_002860 [Syzygium grande]
MELFLLLLPPNSSVLCALRLLLFSKSPNRSRHAKLSHNIMQRSDKLAMNLSIFSSAMEGIAWRGWLYTVFILYFACACQFLLLHPLSSLP